MRLDSLTGLRIFAALMVFGRHVSGTGGMDRVEGEANWLAGGMVGVSFFYIVSGFVLAWTARQRDRPAQFYQRRFARVYPLYAVCWLIALVILLGRGHSITPVDFVPLTLLQAWLPVETVYFAVSAVFWSLSCEAFFYLVFPWIMPRLAKLQTRGRLVLLGAIVVVIFVIAAVVHPLVEGTVGHWLLYFFPPVRLLEFVIGILLALQLKRGTSFRFPLWAAVAVTLVVYFLNALAPASYMRVAIMVVPFALLVWSAARADVLGLRSPFRWRPIVKLGVWSYAFYLIHSEVIDLWLRLLAAAGVDVSNLAGVGLAAALVAAMVLAIVASGILHIFVEAPLERRLRPRGRGPRLDDDATTASRIAPTP